ncbi:hypothetical protein BGZ47_002993 [Haplosporangium gracile]|nr:hypothetical protein BGZ47_002993 [Haplosporangium gracile]
MGYRTLHLYNVLDKLADSFEELKLAEHCNLELYWIVNIGQIVPCDNKRGEGSRGSRADPKEISFLPKLKTLYMDLHWKRSNLEPIYDMMQAFPALETFIIQSNSMLDFARLQPILCEFCLNLRSVQYISHR